MSRKCVKEIEIKIVKVDTSELTEEELKILNCLCSCGESDDDDDDDNDSQEQVSA